MLPERISRYIASSLLCLTVAGVPPAVMAEEPQAAAGSATSARMTLEQMPLYGRMVKANAGLHSYQSHVRLKIAMHTFPFLSPTLEGTAYYKAPDKNAVVFDQVPALASLFKKVFPRLDPPNTWSRLYTVAVVAESANRTVFRLTPKKYGTIEFLDVSVDQTTALPVSYTYQYRNGGHIHFDQAVERIGQVFVVTSLIGHVELPSTNADASSTFTGYKINVPVKDEVFADTAH